MVVLRSRDILDVFLFLPFFFFLDFLLGAGVSAGRIFYLGGGASAFFCTGFICGFVGSNFEISVRGHRGVGVNKASWGFAFLWISEDGNPLVCDGRDGREGAEGLKKQVDVIELRLLFEFAH